MKKILIAAGALALLVGLIALVGAFVPRDHRATCRVRLSAEPARVYALLTDFEAYPSWRPEVESVGRLEPVDGKPAFVERTRQGPMPYSVESSEPERRLVLRILDEDLPFGGTWTFELAREDDATLLSVTEDGFIRNPLFRALARFVFGYHATLEAYLTHLAEHLGEPAEVERLR